LPDRDQFIALVEYLFPTDGPKVDLYKLCGRAVAALPPGTRVIPIDPVSSTVDHFIPGLAVDRRTAGGSAHLGLGYYFYPISNSHRLPASWR
jgi:hypothetical protein